jgi:hypothetical protein
MLLLPNGLPSKLQRETLGRDEISLITTFENWLSRRGLKMDLLCEKCIDEGLPPRVWGDNSRDAASYKVNCSHAERVYGVPITEH